MSEISEIEIKSMTKEQNYMRGYEDGKSDVLDKIRAEIEELDGRYVIGDYAIYREKDIPKYVKFLEVLQIIDKYKAEGEGQHGR